jgi:SRSO17 transposase
MALRGAKGVHGRFTRYVESLVSVIGHADRAGPLRDYCTGLIVSEARKSVEPMAAITAPDRTGAQHQSLLHFVGQGPWSDEMVLAKVREMVLHRLNGTDRSRHGLSTTRAFPKRGSTRLGWRTNTVDNLASRRTAKSPYRCRLPTTRRAFL